MSTLGERGLVFASGEQRLVGVLARPEDAGDVAVLIMVGGPQYRVGSHRQFTLLARDLSRHGYTSLRFDYAGMGDSEGQRARFDAVHADVDAARVGDGAADAVGRASEDLRRAGWCAARALRQATSFRCEPAGRAGIRE